MTQEHEAKRFKKQYEAHWDFLLSDRSFAVVWKAQDFVRCGELAQILIDGNAKTKNEYIAFKAAKTLRN